MFQIDHEAMRKYRYKELFPISLTKIYLDIKKIFEKYAKDYVKDVPGYRYMPHAFLEGIEEGQGGLGLIELQSRDQKSCLRVRIGENKISIESICLKYGISKEFLDELIPCVLKCVGRWIQCHELVFDHVEDEVTKNWCMDHGYEEIVRKDPFSKVMGEEVCEYSYALPVGNERQTILDSIDSIHTRREIYQALMSSKGIELKELIEECACSYLSMESSLGGGKGQENVIGDLAYSSYDASTNIKIQFYTNSIVIYRFIFHKGSIRKCLDECIDKIVELAKYFVDMEEIIFRDVESDAIRNWCLGNGYQADDRNRDIKLMLSDDPPEEQLHSTQVRYLAASLTTAINVCDYGLTFHALNHEVEEDISALDLMKKLISARHSDYSKHEYWEVEANRTEVLTNNFCYDIIDLYKDGRRMNKVVEVHNRDGGLWVKLNIDLDVIWILPEGSIRSIDIVDKDNNYLLRISNNEMVDERYIGSVMYDFRKNIFYNENDCLKVCKWEIVQYS